MGLGRTCRLGRDFKVIWGDKPQSNGTNFMGRVDPSKQHVKILI